MCSTSGGLDPSAKTWYKSHASVIAEKYSLIFVASCQIELFINVLQSCDFLAQHHHTIEVQAPHLTLPLIYPAQQIKMHQVLMFGHKLCIIELQNCSSHSQEQKKNIMVPCTGYLN